MFNHPTSGGHITPSDALFFISITRIYSPIASFL